MDLQTFFAQNPKLALAFSGGTDSAYLLAQGRRFGCEIRPYFLKTAFQPAFELADARRLCSELGVSLTVLALDVLADEQIAANPKDRCYYCKNAIFRALIARAQADGFDTVIDGTNASDDAGDRPGMRALRELGVVSPLRLCGVDKAQVRRQSASLGLFTAQKPSYACLATRIPAGVRIELQTLEKVERGENALCALGFSDLRLRVLDGAAKLQLPAGQLPLAAARAQEIRAALAADFEDVLLDLKPRELENG